MTSKTRSALTTEQTTQFPDNAIGSIAPVTLRGVVQDMIDSMATQLDNSSFSGTQTFVNATATGNISAAGTIKSTGTSSGGVGYGTGAGGAVTQLTSRTTGVTLNALTGAITLFSAAGSATPTTFTVTNSLILVTDVVIVSPSGTSNLYEIFVTQVRGGSSFDITFFTTGGTATDAPVFTFVILRGSTS